MYEVPEHLIIEQVEAHMRQLGISPRVNITLIADGSLHRYTVEGDSTSTKNGAYRIHTDGVPAWYLCDWKRNIDVTGKFDTSGLSGSDKEAYSQRISDKDYMEQVRIRHETLEREERKKKQKAIEEAKALYEHSAPATLEHKYLKRKGVADIRDFRLDEAGNVLIPLYNAKTKDFASLQKVSPNGDKQFVKDTRPGGACYTFEPEHPNERLHIICEGIATGDTIFRLTGKKWRVTCAMNCYNLNSVAKEIKGRYPRADILIGADNDLGTYANIGDNPGRNSAEFVIRAGYARGIIIPDFKASEDGSDWNDYETLNGYENAREEFTRQLDTVLSQPDNSEQIQDMPEDNNSMAVSADWIPPITAYDYVENGIFSSDLKEFQKYPPILSGLSNFDEAQGGFVPGMYIFGGTPSVGKTSFLSQVTDNVATKGNNVLLFSLEQSRLEMVTKSISRLTAQLDKKNHMKNAVSSINIRRGNYVSDTQRELVKKAVEKYQDFSRNITFVEGSFNTTVSDIAETVVRYMSHTGLRPCVIIDYLQIVQSGNDKNANRDAVECVIRRLKDLQRDNNLVMFAVSSFNRSNYTASVDYASFKETGLLEYSADVLLGLQPQVMTNDLFGKEKKEREQREVIDKALSDIPRKVMLKNLKNRYGQRGYSCGFLYDCRFDLFEPDDAFQGERP